MNEKEKEPILEVRELEQWFDIGRGRIFRAVDQVSFEIRQGEIFGLVGESGSGKSTIARSVMRMYRPCGGRIRLLGEEISGKLDRRKADFICSNMQMIFQDPMSSLNPRKRIGDIIGEGLQRDREIRREERRERAAEMMRQVGLRPEYMDRFPGQLSGGQRQRVGIARALIMQPRLIIADECISALDVSIQTQIIQLLRQIREETGTAILFITHDMAVVKYLSDRVGMLRCGKLVETGDAEEIFRSPSHPYTRDLILASPVPDPLTERRKRYQTYEKIQKEAG